MRRRNQKIGIVSYSSRKEEETLINKKRSSSNHKWEGRASAKKGAWRSFILPIRQIIAQTSRSVGPSNGTSTRIKQGRTLGGVLSSSGSSMAANAASSPSTVMGSGLHQQLPFGAGPSAGILVHWVSTGELEPIRLTTGCLCHMKSGKKHTARIQSFGLI